MSTEPEIKGVRIVKIISETKKFKGERPRRGYRRVQAVVSIKGVLHTRHGDTKDGQFLIMKMYGPKKSALDSVTVGQVREAVAGVARRYREDVHSGASQ